MNSIFNSEKIIIEHSTNMKEKEKNNSEEIEEETTIYYYSYYKHSSPRVIDSNKFQSFKDCLK